MFSDINICYYEYKYLFIINKYAIIRTINICHSWTIKVFVVFSDINICLRRNVDILVLQINIQIFM